MNTQKIVEEIKRFFKEKYNPKYMRIVEIEPNIISIDVFDDDIRMGKREFTKLQKFIEQFGFAKIDSYEFKFRYVVNSNEHACADEFEKGNIKLTLYYDRVDKKSTFYYIKGMMIIDGSIPVPYP